MKNCMSIMISASLLWVSNVQPANLNQNGLNNQTQYSTSFKKAAKTVNHISWWSDFSWPSSHSPSLLVSEIGLQQLQMPLMCTHPDGTPNLLCIDGPNCQPWPECSTNNLGGPGPD